MPGPGEVVGALDELHYVRDGRRFMVSTSLGALRGALEVIDEDGQSRLAEHPGYIGARAQLGPVAASGEPPHRLPQLRPAPAEDGDRRPFLREARRDRLADPRATSGHNCITVLENHAVFLTITAPVPGQGTRDVS